MLIKANILEHYNNYLFTIPLSGGENIYIKNGQKIELGEAILSKKSNGINESFFLVDELSCNAKDCMKYITCIDGQYVEKGDVIAQKSRPSGLTIKQIVVTQPGIVDLSRLNKGFVDILGEENDSIVESNFKGTVVEVLPGSHIAVNSPASALDLVATTLFDEKIFGTMTFLNRDLEQLQDIPDVNLKGRIVWADSYLSLNSILKLFQKGASAVLVYCMEYDDFRIVGLPVGVLEGFGKIHCDRVLFEQLLKLEGKFVVLDGQEKQLFIAKDRQDGMEKESYFVQGLLGSTVISRHTAHYGHIGNITQVHDLEYVTVDFGISGKAIVNIGSLDFITL